jgi:hypothetical protein
MRGETKQNRKDHQGVMHSRAIDPFVAKLQGSS